MLVKAGLTSDIINFVIVCAVFFALNYGVFTFCIKKLKIPTQDVLEIMMKKNQVHKMKLQLHQMIYRL